MRNETAIRELRYLFGTQADAADAIQIERATFSRLLNGRTKMTPRYWHKFNSVLGSELTDHLLGPKPEVESGRGEARR